MTQINLDISVVIHSRALLETDGVNQAAVAHLSLQEYLLGERILVITIERQRAVCIAVCRRVADDHWVAALGAFGHELLHSRKAADSLFVTIGLHPIVVECLRLQAFNHVAAPRQVGDRRPLVGVVGAIVELHIDGAARGTPADDGSRAARLGAQAEGIDTDQGAVVLQASHVGAAAIDSDVASRILAATHHHVVGAGIDAGRILHQTEVAVHGRSEQRIDKEIVAAVVFGGKVDIVAASIAAFHGTVSHRVEIRLRRRGAGQASVAPDDAIDDGVVVVVSAVFANTDDLCAAGRRVVHDVAADEGRPVSTHSPRGCRRIVQHHAALKIGIVAIYRSHIARVTHKEATQHGVVLGIETGAQSAAVERLVIGGLRVLHTNAVGVDTATVIVGLAMRDHRILDDGAVVGIDTATRAGLAVLNGEVVDAQAAAHIDTTAICVVCTLHVAVAQREAVPERGSIELAACLHQHTHAVLTVEDGGMLHKVALAEVVVRGFVAREATVDIDALEGREPTVVCALSHPNLHRLTVEAARSGSGIQSPCDAAGGILPRGAVAGAIGCHIVAALLARQGGELHRAPTRRVALAADAAGTHRIGGILTQAGKRLALLQLHRGILLVTFGLVLQLHRLPRIGLADHHGRRVVDVAHREQRTRTTGIAASLAEEHHIAIAIDVEIVFVADSYLAIAIGIQTLVIICIFDIETWGVVVIIRRRAVHNRKYEVVAAVIVVGLLKGDGQPAVFAGEVHQAVVDQLLLAQQDSLIAVGVAAAAGGAHIDFQPPVGIQPAGELEAQCVNDAAVAQLIFQEQLL